MPSTDGAQMSDHEVNQSVHNARVKQRLRAVRWVALADLFLLVALVAASRLDQRALVSLLGPLHGGNFLLLLVVIYTGVTDGLWHWAYLLGTFVSGGPIGALVGEVVVARRLRQSVPNERSRV